MADVELDTRGLNCPVPIMRAKKAMETMKVGQTLLVVATDPGSVKDFSAFAKQMDCKLLESKKVNDEFIFLLLK